MVTWLECKLVAPIATGMYVVTLVVRMRYVNVAGMYVCMYNVAAFCGGSLHVRLAGMCYLYSMTPGGSQGKAFYHIWQYWACVCVCVGHATLTNMTIALACTVQWRKLDATVIAMCLLRYKSNCSTPTQFPSHSYMCVCGIL